MAKREPRGDRTPEQWEADARRFARECARHPGRRWRVSTEPTFFGEPIPRARPDCFENQGDFDELVVDHWIHLERMDTHTWWMRLGQREFDIEIERTGEVKVHERTGE